MGRIRCTGTNRIPETIYVESVSIDPSAASWVVVITDTVGNIVFSAKGADATSRSFLVHDTWVGANITTSTNITATYIYTK